MQPYIQTKNKDFQVTNMYVQECPVGVLNLLLQIIDTRNYVAKHQVQVVLHILFTIQWY